MTIDFDSKMFEKTACPSHHTHAHTNAVDPTAPLPREAPQFEPDRLYRNYFNAAPDFCFDAHVAHVFPDMIRRSVPGYGTVLELIHPIVLSCVQPGDRVYDLGCSVGAGLLAVQNALQQITASSEPVNQPIQHPINQTITQAFNPKENVTVGTSFSDKPTQLIGLDASTAMLHKAAQLINVYQRPNEKASTAPHDHTPSKTAQQCQITLQQADITQYAYQPCRLILMNYTLQFIPLIERDALIQKLFDALVPGGLLMLSEKVLIKNPTEAVYLQALHERFKVSQGYSALEVTRKREAIDNVLVRESEAAHRERLVRAGFRSLFSPMHCLEFITLIAEKPATFQSQPR